MAIGIGCQLLTYACHRLGGAAASRATAAHGVEESTAEAQPAQYESEFTVTADDDPEEFPDDTELRLPELTACPPPLRQAPQTPYSYICFACAASLVGVREGQACGACWLEGADSVMRLSAPNHNVQRLQARAVSLVQELFGVRCVCLTNQYHGAICGNVSEQPILDDFEQPIQRRHNIILYCAMALDLKLQLDSPPPTPESTGPGHRRAAPHRNQSITQRQLPVLPAR